MSDIYGTHPKYAGYSRKLGKSPGTVRPSDQAPATATEDQEPVTFRRNDPKPEPHDFM